MRAKIEQGPCSTNSQVKQRLKEMPFLNYTSIHWGHHVKAHGEYEQTDPVCELLSSRPRVLSLVQIMSYCDKDWDLFDIYRSDFCQSDIPEKQPCSRPEKTINIHLLAHFNLSAILSSGCLEAKRLDRRDELLEVKDDWGRTPLRLAAQSDSQEVVKELLQCNLEVNAPCDAGLTPLLSAIWTRRGALAGLLLACNKVDKNAIDYRSQTSLFIAVCLKLVEVIKVLLGRNDVDVNAPTKKEGIFPFVGMSPLHAAIFLRPSEIVQLLLDCEDINVNATTARG